MGGQIARTDAHITGTTENNGHGQTSIGQCRTSNDNIRSINGHSSESNTGDGVRERLVGPSSTQANKQASSKHANPQASNHKNIVAIEFSDVFD